MKNIVMLVMGLAVAGCSDTVDTTSEFTGNEVVYQLNPGSVYDINGTASFKEKKDGSTLVVVKLNGTEGDLKHPVHLHLGNISTPDADIAALLNPVSGLTGKSETHITQLANEESISFNDLVDLNACLKIHLSGSGPNSLIILAAGNIGSAVQSAPGGRLGISICKSE